MNLKINKKAHSLFFNSAGAKKIWVFSGKEGKTRKQPGWGWRAKPSFKIKGALWNVRGQGLIEYLILVALMGVATIGIVRTLNQTVKSRFANSIYALQGRNQKAKTHNMRKEEYQRSDLSNFMSGASSSDKKKKPKKK